MKDREKREWFLFIALLVALFVIFALWSSKEKVEIPVYRSEGDLSAKKPHKGGDREDGSNFVDEEWYQEEDVGEIRNPMWPIDPETLQHGPQLVEIIESEAPEDLEGRIKSITQREEVCRAVFEDIYKTPFPKVRPDFLLNPHPRSRGKKGKKGRNLELDGYNEELKIAFECNGRFHYEPHVFTANSEDHKYQLWKDKFKHDRCRELGITVITIPYNVKKKDIPVYIEERLPHFRDVVDRLKARGWDVPSRPLQTPSYEGLAEPSIHMGDTRSGDNNSDVSFSSSYLDAMS